MRHKGMIDLDLGKRNAPVGSGRYTVGSKASNPACVKCRSEVNARESLSSRITTKLVQSVNE